MKYLPRYVALEIDGKWYVMDRKCPLELEDAADELEALTTARVWNLFSEAIREESE